MADRTVNVRINYIVNTAEIQRAEAASRAAQKATDDLRKATDAYGKATSTASKQASDGAREATNSFQGLYSTVKLILAAGIIREIADLSINMAKLAGNVEGVTRAFDRLPNSKKLLEDLRRSTHGTITDLQLMQQAIRAQNFNIPLKNLGMYLEFAAIRAQQTGESVDYMVNSIVTGLGRDSIKILDNLQVDIGAMKKRMEEAGISIDEAFSEQVLLQMKKGGEYIETQATEVDRLAVAWTKWKTEASDSTLWAGIVANLTAFVEATAATGKVIWSVVTSIYGLENNFLSFSDIIAKRRKEEIIQASANEFMQRRFTSSKEDNIKVLEEEIALMTHELGAYAKQRDAAKKTVEFLQDEMRAGRGNAYEIQNNIDVLQKYHKTKSEDVKIDQEILKVFQAKILALKAEISANKEAAQAAKDKRHAEFIAAQSKVTDPVKLFDIKPIAKKTTAQKSLEQELVDVKAQIEAAIKSLPGIKWSITPYFPKDETDKFLDALDRNRSNIIISSSNVIQNLINADLQAEVDTYNVRIDNTRDFYNKQIDLAGDNEKAKQRIRIQADKDIRKLEIERADREKKAAQAGILVNTALGIVKAISTAVTVYDGLIQAAIVAAEGASQYAIASRARYYAKGEIDIKGGQAGKDSIPAMLTPGESIMTSRQTREAFGILTDVRAGRLNDKVLKQIVASGGSQASFNDVNIVNKLDEIRQGQYDLIESGGLLYKQYRKGSVHKKRIRAKTIGDF